jgi:adenylate cyclase
MSGPRHAARACEAALALSRTLGDATPPAAPEGDGRIRLRIGINSGLTATGDIGARHRYNFKALGDTVNVAARLEQLGRDMDDGLGDVILVSHATREMSEFDAARFDDLGSVHLRGKQASTGVARLRR